MRRRLPRRPMRSVSGWVAVASLTLLERAIREHHAPLRDRCRVWRLRLRREYANERCPIKPAPRLEIGSGHLGNPTTADCVVAGPCAIGTPTLPCLRHRSAPLPSPCVGGTT